jgi:hypothetical protein
VDIAPPDDSVDSNGIIIEGEGDITSLGTGPGGFINKRIVFRPAGNAHGKEPPGEGGPKPEITLHHNPPELVLITGQDRIITEECYGAYVCNDQGHWFELYFTPTGAAATENRLAAMETRLLEMEQRLADRPAKRTRKKDEP